MYMKIDSSWLAFDQYKRIWLRKKKELTESFLPMVWNHAQRILNRSG